jgi:hypothetical protein
MLKMNYATKFMKFTNKTSKIKKLTRLNSLSKSTFYMVTKQIQIYEIGINMKIIVAKERCKLNILKM